MINEVLPQLGFLEGISKNRKKSFMAERKENFLRAVNLQGSPFPVQKITFVALPQL